MNHQDGKCFHVLCTFALNSLLSYNCEGSSLIYLSGKELSNNVTPHQPTILHHHKKKGPASYLHTLQFALPLRFSHPCELVVRGLALRWQDFKTWLNETKAGAL